MSDDEDELDGIDALLDRAGEALEHGDAETALTLHAQASEIDREDREVLSFAIVLASAKGDGEAVMAAIEDLLDVHPDEPVALVTAAGWLTDFMYNPDAALPLLELAIEQLGKLGSDPELRQVHADALVLMSSCLGDTGDPEGALAAAEKAQAIDSKSIEIEIALAKAELDLRRFAKAIARLAPRAKEDPEAMWLLGWAHRLAADTPAAKKAFAAAERASPAFAQPMSVPAGELERTIANALSALPEPLAALARGVPVVVEPEPSASDPPRALFLAQGDAKPTLLRFFQANIEVVAGGQDLRRVIDTLLVNEIDRFVEEEADEDD